MGYRFTAYTANLLNLAGETVRLLRVLADPSWYELIATLRFLFDLIDLVDAVEKAILRIRPLERYPGTVDRLHSETLSRIVELPDRAALVEQRAILLRPFEAIPCCDRQPLRIALVGDLYTMIEPFFNMDLERELGRLGVHVQRSFWLSDDARDSLHSTVLRRGRGAQKRKAAEPYLSRDIGGFARRTVGDAALLAQSGVDGLIHLAPFNCAPEVVAHNALLAMQRDQGVPLLALSFDEHTARAGLLTRLEAFVDLLARRPDRRPSGHTWQGWTILPSFGARREKEQP